MKQKMYSKQSNTYLHTHIIDQFSASHKGIKGLLAAGHIDEREYTSLLEKNSERLIDRIREFRIVEKMMSISFALLFTWMQATDEDLDMRKARRMRLRRRNETEQTLYL